MFRFPNPGSSIKNFIKIFIDISNQLSDYRFSLDDMVSVSIDHKMVSSTGFVGEKALQASTRKDRSRDPLYNQLKMYAELFRHFGWIKSSEKKALEYHITPFGRLLSESEDPIDLFIKSILCMSYPNNSIESKHQGKIKPFYTILIIIKKINNFITRDEIILHILNCKNDSGEKNINKIVNDILESREKNNLNILLNNLSETLKIQVNTLRNYTRSPIMFLRDSGLFKKVSNDKFQITSKGELYHNKFFNFRDVRIDDLSKLEDSDFNLLNNFIFKNLFEKQEKIKSYDILRIYKLLNISEKQQILFNPFQQLNLEELINIFDWQISQNTFKKNKLQIKSNKDSDIEKISRNKIALVNNNILNPINLISSDINELDKINLGGSKSEILKQSKEFSLKVIKYKIDKFYPFVEQLFSRLGFECLNSRVGVNYERWDSRIIHNNKIIPIEIKSPTEETHLSVKGVRQALENKIILESRYSSESSIKHNSLVVGYKLPNRRSEVFRLVDDIFNTYKIKISMIDIETMIFLIFWSKFKGQSIDKDQFVHVCGQINHD